MSYHKECKLHTLGTGIAIVTKYKNTAFVLDNGEDYFLVDGMGGIDILRAFEEHDIDWRKLHYAFLSHEHTDHFVGMIWVVRYIAYQMTLDQYDGDFYLYGHSVVLEKLDAVCRMLLRPQETELIGDRIFFIVVNDMEERIIWNCDFLFFDIQSTKAKQFGFRMIWPDGMRFVFLGDEPAKKHVFPLCQDADWVTTEAFCLYEDREIHTPYQYHHSTVKEASEIAENCHVKNLILWHTEEATYGRRKERYSLEAKQYYSGNVYVPDDGEIITLSNDRI